MLERTFTTVVAGLNKFRGKSRKEKAAAVRSNVRHMLTSLGIGGDTPRHIRTTAVNADQIRQGLDALAIIGREQYVKELLSDPIYQDRKRLPPFGFKVYSQNDEDGIIQEIFARIGTTTRTFVEFGVEDGLESNTVKLLLEGWTGLWLEGSADDVDRITRKFSDVIETGRLTVRRAFIDRDNLNELIGSRFSGEIDLISIDVDGNDIHFLEALSAVNPRVIVSEYNGKFPPPMNITPVYDPAYQWRGTDYMGASLVALTRVAERKGYYLVGCNITGVNAFFVRGDLLGDRFCAPYIAENHFQPARYFLTPSFKVGHEPDWGKYMEV